MTIISAERLARVFVDVADTLVDEFDLIDFLHQLATRTADLLDNSPVGLLLTDQRGRLRFMAASEHNVELLELFGIQEQDGPALEAVQTGQAIVNADLAASTDRWPLFASQAVAAGFRSVHAFPLRLRQDTIGALTVVSSEITARLSPADIDIVQALADVAAIGLLQERAISRGEVLVEQLQGALNSRIVIEQAKGMVAHARGVSVNDAFALIRAYARNHNLRLSDVARALFDDPGLVTELTHN